MFKYKRKISQEKKIYFDSYFILCFFSLSLSSTFAKVYFSRLDDECILYETLTVLINFRFLCVIRSPKGAGWFQILNYVDHFQLLSNSVTNTIICKKQDLWKQAKRKKRQTWDMYEFVLEKKNDEYNGRCIVLFYDNLFLLLYFFTNISNSFILCVGVSEFDGLHLSR